MNASPLQGSLPMYDLRHLIHSIESAVTRHNLGKTGAYCRWSWQSPGTDSGRDLGLNPYGCADAANILYTIGHFPDNPTRAAWIETLQSFQDPASGLFEEPTHHPIHTTAHCIAALELFDARPRYPLAELEPLRKTYAMAAFLDRLDWRANPWRESHRGAGLYAALVLAGEVNLEWEDRYFAWLWEEADPITGFWRNGRVAPVPHADAEPTIFPHLAGTFHYLFNHEYARRPLRYPAAIVDSCLGLYHEGRFPLGLSISFSEIDWVYCLSRALRQCGHRFQEARWVLEGFTERYITYLSDIDPQTDDDFNDLHLLFGMVCCLAELQQAVPGLLRTQRPLRLVLDRRPFI